MRLPDEDASGEPLAGEPQSRPHADETPGLRVVAHAVQTPQTPYLPCRSSTPSNASGFSGVADQGCTPATLNYSAASADAHQWRSRSEDNFVMAVAHVNELDQGPVRQLYDDGATQ